ncbi:MULTISPECIES: hypothetical protein [Rhodocyclales]|uniref:Uncharacterized protein n=1 Tax=Azonexus hydrophilus TaxID=418702 RepID=A0ABZ2XPX2_9RHOO|nr:hypothetical protein [Azospira sp. I09]BBN90562.1 hypothetical protein AZSP09_35850 [Azospira sp. I09]
MDAKHTSVEVIQREVGRWNTDIALGWETGLQGKKRIGNRLYERHPPDHFLEPQNHARYTDWLRGYEKATQYRRFELRREVHYVGENESGPVKGVYQGWGIKRGSIVSRLIDKHGCYGDVYFYYFEGTKIVRTVKCGI